MINCKVCGKELSGKSLYCSQKCKERHRYSNTTYTKQCISCGKEFTGKRGSVVCSEKCSLVAQRKHKKTCPVCKSEFDSRGNGVYCSNVCYRLANNRTKGLIIANCEVCNTPFRKLTNSEELTCSHSCKANLFSTYIRRAHLEVFKTDNQAEIRNIINSRRKKYNEEKH